MSKTISERMDDRQARRDGTSGEPGGETQRVPVNVYETDNAVVIVAPLPGVMPEDVSVTVEAGQVTITASMRSPAPKDYLVHEWHYGPFERAVVTCQRATAPTPRPASATANWPSASGGARRPATARWC